MRSAKWLVAVVALLAAGAWATTPAKLDHTPYIPSEIDVVELAKESTADLIPGTEKRLSWYDGPATTEWAVVALHGFSASRQETAPLSENLAQALSANLFETRLHGHGMQHNGMTDVSAEAWLDDAAQALAIGAEIGDKVIVVGVSTGATLAASLLNHESMTSVDSLIFISPNYFPFDPNAAWMTRPFGTVLTRWIIGETRSWEPYNDAQGRYWTTRYPSATLIEAMRLVDYANAQLPVDITQRLLVFYSPSDEVISTDALLRAYEHTSSPQKQLIEVAEVGDPSNHVLAGNALSPNSTTWIKNSILKFVLSSDKSSDETDERD